MDISSMLEVQVNEVKEVDSKENVTPKEPLPSTTNVPLPISQEEYSFYKLMFGNDVSKVRFQRLHCTACDTHIGSAPADAHNMFEHPTLRTLLCAKCREFYGDGTFEQGDDATDMFCRWCANGGNLYCCSFCSNTFCYKCIKRNFDPVLRKKIEADERWKCFVCDPTDLYSARGTCWALLQHIQTMNRLFQNTCKLSQEEIDEKMNTDESKCCPRRRKRKRRRNGSNSEEDDETYIPKQITPNVISKRRKRGRGKTKFSNGSNMSMSDKFNSGMSEDSSVDHSEILPSLLSCEQTMVECENATVSGDGTIISQPQVNPGHHRMNSSITQQSTMYNTSVVNVVANSNFLQSTPTIVPLRHIPNSLKQANQVNLYQTLHSASTPMVAIPNQNVKILDRSRFSLSESQKSRKSTNLNVIEIESDPEDLAVVGPSRLQRPLKKYYNTHKAVPVALVSSKNNYNNAKRQEIQERRNAKTLNQRLLPHGKEINSILVNLKMKFQGLFDTTKREELKKYELNDARNLIKQFHCEIRDTVTQLACINDRIVREYNRWKRYQAKVRVSLSLNTDNTRKKIQCKEIPLDMTCINESDTESNIGNEIEYSIMDPSELVGTTNAVDGINFFKKRSTIERGVGDHPALLVDKSVQINTMELQDYDRCIRHSTLKKVNQQSDKKNDTPIKQANKQSANYEEHFIQFLQKQNLKSRSMQAENLKELPDPNETSLKDLIEANSPFISEMLETMDKSAASSSNSNLSISVKRESDLRCYEPRRKNSITCKAVNDLVKMVSNINDDLEKKTVANESIGNDLQKQSEIQKRHFSTANKVCVINVSKNNEQNSSKTIAIEFESNNEDDCTIIDN
ncbi:PREDICTED: transcriptional regulator ATRX-like [Eufriesea mexicana]|uniref:transcriptional regulator ATRX-like n=1 Tax=Eufriesea mexicana TaxID=516756 RepID=UPI00083C2272|nr:PREDICTED: transcriptional regulator ATRX-like [Eufriesea mexicana]